MIKLNKPLLGALAFVGLFTLPAMAQTLQMDTSGMPTPEEGMGMGMGLGTPVILGDLELSGYFTRAMPPRAVTGGGFVTIVNNGENDDRLVSVTSLVAEHVELHNMNMDGEVMKMQSQPDGFIIAAGEKVELKPGGKHIMFIGVETSFAEGDDVKVVLQFEQAGKVELILHAIPIGANAMTYGKMEGSNMDHSTMGAETSSN